MYVNTHSYLFRNSSQFIILLQTKITGKHMYTYLYIYTHVCMHMTTHLHACMNTYIIYIYIHIFGERERTICVCVFKLIGTSSCLTSVWVYYTCVYIYAKILLMNLIVSSCDHLAEAVSVAFWNNPVTLSVSVPREMHSVH